MDFAIPEPLVQLQSRVKGFIAPQGILLESDPRQGAHGPDESLRRELIGRARAAP